MKVFLTYEDMKVLTRKEVQGCTRVCVFVCEMENDG